MKRKLLHLLGSLLVLAIFVLAVWLLVGQLWKYTWSDILARLREIPWHSVVAAIGITLFNYTILVAYDLLAVRYVGERLALWRVALASFTGYACSYNFGATLAGTTIRYRLYSAWGVAPLKIVQLLVILGLTFWFGVFALAGVVFIFAPLHIPPENLQKILEDMSAAMREGHVSEPVIRHLLDWFQFLFADSRPFGTVLLTIAAGYLGLSALHRGTLRLWRWQIPVPPFKLSVYQVLIASADMLVAAWVLYELFPKLTGGYLEVLGIFMVAYVLVVLSHVPGGWGVLEAVIITLVGALEPEATADVTIAHVIAGLLIFRVVYFLVPLLVAAVLLGGYELVLRKSWLERMLGRTEQEVANRPNSPPESSP